MENMDSQSSNMNPPTEEIIESRSQYTHARNKKRKLEPPVESHTLKKPRGVPNPKTTESGDIAPPEPELPDRALRILDHWDAARGRYNKNPGQNARKLIWQFIDETGDLEFSEWIQSHLLQQLPKLVSMRAHRTTTPLRIVALERKITWDDFKQVFMKVDDLPPFMREEAA